MTSLTHNRLVAPKGQRIGLLGGSFNPAHEGHMHLSRLAFRHLNLDRVWWLVSPQNPLKSSRGMAPLAARLEKARTVAAHPHICVTDIETRLGTQYTADTLVALKKKFPGGRFVWLMGADNLVQIDQWYKWTAIFMTLPVAIFARPPYSLRAENATAVRRFSRSRVDRANAKGLADMKPPAWAYLKTPLNPVSATEIRSRLEGAWAD
ncbi:MAG: nicotinate-nucleotide adenylyltransferase [Rhodospirillales bacterium]|nr:nicotinate-nucleotide adenylyltransferase [Rhodospirillales bacterium]